MGLTFCGFHFQSHRKMFKKIIDEKNTFLNFSAENIRKRANHSNAFQTIPDKQGGKSLKKLKNNLEFETKKMKWTQTDYLIFF
jgi:hypothetical protein